MMKIKKNKMSVSIKDFIGNPELLLLPKTAFLCSRRFIASAVLECYDWAIAQRKRGRCIISGFHSPIERDVLHFLSKGDQPLILALHKGLQREWEPGIKKMLGEGRLLIVTPFVRSVTQGSEETAMVRNRLALALADEVKIGYASPGGNVERLLSGL